MSELRQTLTDYLALRRAMGYKLARDGACLEQFVAYLEAAGRTQITTKDALAWATAPGRGQAHHYNRLQAVRGFAKHLHAVDPSCEVPPADLLVRGPCRATPYLYSDREIIALMAAAETLSSTRHRRATIKTLIGLLAATGLRISEARGLDRDDVDFTEGLLLVRQGKFGKDRALPLHESTLRALRRYLHRPDRPPAPPGERALFVSRLGTRLDINTIEHTFRTLRRRTAIAPHSAASRPRLHDLRHTFAVRTLLDAYRSGEDVQARVALLSTYLGHARPEDTYWYLQAAPELLALAGERLERHLQGGAKR